MSGEEAARGKPMCLGPLGAGSWELGTAHQATVDKLEGENDAS
jgi:hypothetical protein